MTSSRIGETSNPASFAQFANAVQASMPAHSRRDIVRSAAILTAAAGMALESGRLVARAQDSSGHSAPAGDIETGVELVIPFNPYGQPINLDPHRAPNWGPFWVLLPHVWSGLLAFDENGAVVTDLADSVEPNEAGDIWTARLKPDQLYGTGNPVTAQSLVDSWLRALDPQRPAPMSSFMDLVKGYEEYVSGTSADIGFKVIDDLTIEITLAEPYSSFPASLATFVWAAMDLTVLDDPGIDDPAIAGAGAGPWQFTESTNFQVVMEPSPNAGEQVSPSISRVVWMVLQGPDADSRALDLYRTDDVVSVDVPATLFQDVSDDDSLSGDLVSIASQSSTMAIGMDFNQEPFGDIRVRQAVAAAVDRASWSDDIWKGEFVPATGMVPPVVGLTSDYTNADLIAFDPDRAAELLSGAGIDPEQNMPDIVFYQPASDSPAHIAAHAALLEMIATNSGLTIRQDATLTIEQIDALQADNGGRQFDIVWYWTVTDTPALLQTVGQSSSPYMAGRFNWSSENEAIDDQDPAAASSQFDELIGSANQSIDPSARTDAFQQAEKILLENAVYVPLGHWVQRYVQKPWLQGTRQGPWSGRIPVRFDADVVVKGRTQT